MSDVPNFQREPENPENELFQDEMAAGDWAHSAAAGDQQRKRGASTLLVTGLLMAVTMFSFEAAKQSIFHHLSIWQSHGITIGFSTITAVVVASILLRVNQRRDLRLAHEISQRRLMEVDIRERKPGCRDG